MPSIAKSPSCKEAYVFQICDEMKKVHEELVSDIARWKREKEPEMVAMIKSDLDYSEWCLAQFEVSEDMQRLYDNILINDTSPREKHEVVLALLEEVL
jgi:hypothetical protein